MALELFKGADEIDDAGDAEVFSGAGAGFDGNGAQGRGAALGEQDAVNAGAVGYAQEGAEILGVFHSVQGEQKAARRRSAAKARRGLRRRGIQERG